MFERDKNELRDLGIPLETGRVSSLDPTEGYRINRDAYALPAVELTADEAAAVAVATQLWESPELITATQGALLKLRAAGVDVDPDAPVAITSPAGMPGLRGSEDVLGVLLSAIDSGQAVQFPHRPRAPSRTPSAPSSRGAWSPTAAAGTSSGTTATATPPAPSGCPASVPTSRRSARPARSARPTASTCARSSPRRSPRRRPARRPGVGRRRPRHRAAARRHIVGRRGSWAAAPATRSTSTSESLTGWPARSPATAPTPSCWNPHRCATTCWPGCARTRARGRR